MVHDICLTTKKHVCTVKNFIKTLKINQETWTCADAVMKPTRGGGVKGVFFPPKEDIVRHRWEMRGAGRVLLSGG